MEIELSLAWTKSSFASPDKLLFALLSSLFERAEARAEPLSMLRTAISLGDFFFFDDLLD
jgi:hypothetical protein